MGERFREPVCGWLTGSVVTGEATSTSDLDVVVLLDGPDARPGCAPDSGSADCRESRRRMYRRT
ncbi:nucleotidyltransferase domain-containing protein [Demetria terragena]|uniref:nucleotidyltransferase domain-containing protein n=1 Tax=Demetria terragena TaxID=63959 RepID=UPI003CCBD49F